MCGFTGVIIVALNTIFKLVSFCTVISLVVAPCLNYNIFQRHAVQKIRFHMVFNYSAPQNYAWGVGHACPDPLIGQESISPPHADQPLNALESNQLTPI